MAKVGIVMGSDSDLPVMSKAAEILERFGVEYEMTIISAHREPDVFYEYAKSAEEKGFRVIIVLPRGTNTDKPAITPANPEDRMLFARNKWLLAHPDASESKKGAYVGLTGVNIDIAADI